MPKYNYQCLYCGHYGLSLAGFNDHMALCSQCGNLMLRLDNDIFWQCFDKNHFQLIAKEHCSPTLATGIDIVGNQRSIRLNFGQRLFIQLKKWTPRANPPPCRVSARLLACRGQRFCDKKLVRGKSGLRNITDCNTYKTSL
jgi:hypothetical protein